MSQKDSSSAKRPDDKGGKCTSRRPPIVCPPHQCLAPCSCKGFTRTEFDIQEYMRLVESKNMPWELPPAKKHVYGF